MLQQGREWKPTETGNRILSKPHILLIGLVLVAFNSYWCLMGTEVWHSHAADDRLPVLQCGFPRFSSSYLLTYLLQRFMPRLAMSQADLQTIYVMVVMVTTISGHTMMGYLIPVLMRIPSSSQPPKNEWLSLFGNNIPSWIAVKSPRYRRRVLQWRFYTLYLCHFKTHGSTPVLAWSSFVIALWLTLLGGDDFSP